tara:strand:- start:333 stop:437 length:105 start_codon:yes stop_codon:yes gene_type:complete
VVEEQELLLVVVDLMVMVMEIMVQQEWVDYFACL